MNNDLKRISRLMAIITQFQTKRLITANDLAIKFDVTKRTIYRDLKVLEEAGIPILTQEGKGYTLMDGYKMPPIMFSEEETNALITAEKIVQKNTDTSFVKQYNEAMNKIKAILRYDTKDKANLLGERIAYIKDKNNYSINLLSNIQAVITNFQLVEITYCSLEKNEQTKRKVEPFALYNTQDNWVLVAFCRLRKDFRAFRLDRIDNIIVLEENFQPHKMTLQKYFASCEN
jgi:predicted DNA-binding transcriptional regulator YafY